ncbi:C2orf73 [Branchiostoma lanceolatum]|uniref:C2orf73 protein n=1 Tax=Branchiostoma lanceolatum TaxID=7740 RepID=A0A8K0EPK6_BRALA|nr:C2orf73 [Branchiostoma lanceolatum]
MPGHIQQKKRVEDRYNPDTNRIFNDTIPDFSLAPLPRPPPPVKQTGRETPPLPIKKDGETRGNMPHPLDVGFLRKDPRLINEPICHVSTWDTAHIQHQWWPDKVPDDSRKQPNFDPSTTQRADYLLKDGTPPGQTRHASNPNTAPAHGIAPVTFLRPRSADGPRILLEQISYQHQYNSRLDPNEPIRAKRHGSFVWSNLKPSVQSEFSSEAGSSHASSQEGSRRSSAALEEPRGDLGSTEPEGRLEEASHPQTPADQTTEAPPIEPYESVLPASKPKALTPKASKPTSIIHSPEAKPQSGNGYSPAGSKPGSAGGFSMGSKPASPNSKPLSAGSQQMSRASSAKSIQSVGMPQLTRAPSGSQVVSAPPSRRSSAGSLRPPSDQAGTPVRLPPGKSIQDLQGPLKLQVPLGEPQVMEQVHESATRASPGTLSPGGSTSSKRNMTPVATEMFAPADLYRPSNSRPESMKSSRSSGRGSWRARTSPGSVHAQQMSDTLPPVG